MGVLQRLLSGSRVLARRVRTSTVPVARCSRCVLTCTGSVQVRRFSTNPVVFFMSNGNEADSEQSSAGQLQDVAEEPRWVNVSYLYYAMYITGI